MDSRNTNILILANLWRKAGLKEKSPQSLESTAGAELGLVVDVVVVVVVVVVVL